MEMMTSFTPAPSTQITVSTGKTFAISFLPLFSTQTGRLHPPPTPAPDHAPCPNAITNQNKIISFFLVEHCAYGKCPIVLCDFPQE